MGLNFTLEESNFIGYIPDDAKYPAQVEDVVERIRNFPSGETARRVAFKFKLIAPDDPHDGDILWGETSDKFTDHPNCRLYAWSEALLGFRLPPHFNLNTDDLIGKRCIVTVQLNEWEKNGQIQQGNRVKDLQPTRQSAENLAKTNKPDDYDEF